MSVLPSISLLLDLSSVMAGKTRQWQEYSRVGQCYVPQVVYEEIQFLCDRAPEPNLEKTAREFMRFYPTSGWQLATSNATHASLTPPDGQALSKQARLALLTAQCGYGLSKEQGDKLVVFVADSQPLLQRIQALGANNLCGITSTALLQWSRTRQPPPAVTQQLQAIKSMVGAIATTKKAQSTVSTNSKTSPSDRPMTGPASAARMTRTTPSRSTSAVVSQMILSLLTLVVVTAVGLFVWRIVQPASFNKFWNQLGLPALPGQQPATPKKPVKK